MEIMGLEEGIELNGFYLSSIVGDSMMPLLRQGKDLVKVVAAPDRLEKYDIALFKRPTGQYVLHRVFAVKNNYYVICGDNRFSREKIPFDRIVAVAESVYIDDVEIKMTDERQVKYAKRICRTFWIRRIKNKLTCKSKFRMKD